MESWEYAHIQRNSTLVQQQRRCPNTRSNAKKACFLSQERNWHAEARVYFSEFGKSSSPQIYWSVKFFPFTETDKELLQKIREDIVGGPSIVFTRKAVVDETFIRNSRNVCISIVGIDASQLFPYSMCQPMPTGLHTRWEYDTESNSFQPQQIKSRNSENMIMSYFRRQRPDCKIECFYTIGTQKRMIFVRQMVFAHIVILCLRLWAASIITDDVRKHEFL